MKLRISIFMMFALSFRVLSQDFQPDLSQWDIGILRKAKTSSFSLFTPNKSGQVNFYCNLARMDGTLFVQSILLPYLESKGDTDLSDFYKSSLIADLNRLPQLKPLRSSLILNFMAKSYAKKSGKEGIIGHSGFDQRFWLLERLGRTVGENCAYYGKENSLDVVIELLIDAGVENLGHRRNILSPTFTRVGNGFFLHRVYDKVWVMEFSGQ